PGAVRGQPALGVLHRRRGARLRGRPGRRHVAVPGVLPRAARTRRVRATQRVRGVVRLRRARRRLLRRPRVGAPVRGRGRGGGRTAVMTRTVVHLLRHGEVHNPEKILYGRLPNFRLSETGRHQAEVVAKAFTDIDLVAVLASPMQRAQETAAPTAAAHDLPVLVEDGLIEAGNTFEGRRVGVGDGALRDVRNWPLLRDPFTPSWGEPYLHIAHRMLGAVHRARELAEGHEALCVSHQLPIWTLRRFVEGKRLWHDPRRRQCSLASVTSLVFNGAELTHLAYSEPAGGSAPTATGA